MLQQKDFISVVIPALNRFHYLKKLVKSIHEFADYPFEIVIHDDNSFDTDKKECYEKLSSFVSTLILNTGHECYNLGLAESADRATALAASNFIFFINADCIIKRPIFKDIVNVLSKSFVGYLAPMEERKSNEYYKNQDTKYILTAGIGGGACIAYKKSVWAEVNGFSGSPKEGMWSGGADTHFLNACWKAGYFRASLLGENPIYNISLSELGNSDTTITNDFCDCSLPKIFKYNLVGKKYYEECKIRYANIDHDKHQLEKIPFERNNTQFWHGFTHQLIDFPKINWEIAKETNAIRFRDMIESEQIYMGF